MQSELCLRMKDAAQYVGPPAFREGHIHYVIDKGFAEQGERKLPKHSPEYFINHWQYDGELGEIGFLQTEIRPGFEVWVTRALLKKEMICTMQNYPTNLCFGFCLSGRSISRMSGVDGDIVMCEGQHGVFRPPNSSGASRLRPGIPHLHLGINLTLDQLRHFFKDDLHQLPPIIRHSLEKREHCNYYHMGRITPAMYGALRQILDCRQSGLARKLFWEGRALELISYQLETFNNAEEPTVKPKAIHPEDRRKTEYAQSLLVKDIAKPPHLKELTKAVGMSHPKLNRCFKQLFGSTVFEYLRNERLLRANEMLERPGVTVTEVAYAMGYSSPSHFTRAYKKQFGRSPSINQVRARTIEPSR